MTTLPSFSLYKPCGQRTMTKPLPFSLSTLIFKLREVEVATFSMWLPRLFKARRNMASRENISRVRVGRTVEYRNGTDTELLAVERDATELFVLCGSGERFHGAQAFRAGRLSLHMIRVNGSAVCLVSCVVGDHQWLLAKDSPVLRVEACKYVFAMPGFRYGLALPVSKTQHECRTLEEILMRFCDYRDLEEAQGSESQDDVWAHGYEEIRKLTATGVAATESARWRQIQRAVRTSAVVKLLSRSLLIGAIDPRKHLDLTVGNNLPGVQVVAQLLEVIETGRRAVLGDCNGPWCMNEEGIKQLLTILSAFSIAQKRKRPRLDALSEEPEEASSGHTEDHVGDDSGTGGMNFFGRGERLENEMDIY